MKKIFSVLFLGLMIVAFLASCSPKASPEVLVGRWQETWDVGNPGSNVSYQDIYIIALNGSKLAFSTEGRPHHQFEKISFNGKRLSVTLNNNGFLVVYEMELAKDGKKMTGEATTKDGKYKILWEKIE